MTVSAIQQHLHTIIRDLDARRFRGEDPPILLTSDDTPETIIAKTLAAQALHALLDLDGDRFNPDEEAARKRFLAGVGILDYWNFRDARRLFDEASKRARQPLLQQRITLYRLLTDYLKEIVTTDFDRTVPAGAASAVIEPLARLDRLSTDERSHFRSEIERLGSVREALKSDPFLQTVWLLAQARISMDSSESTQGLTWLLAAAQLNRARIAPSPYLQDLLDRARRRILRLIGEGVPPFPEALSSQSGEESPNPNISNASLSSPVEVDAPDPSGKAGKQRKATLGVKETPPDDKVRPYNLYEALVVSLDAEYGESVRSATRAFRIKRYFDNSETNGTKDDV